MSKLIVMAMLLLALLLRQVASAARASERVLTRAQTSLINRCVKEDPEEKEADFAIDDEDLAEWANEQQKVYRKKSDIPLNETKQ